MEEYTFVCEWFRYPHAWKSLKLIRVKAVKLVLPACTIRVTKYSKLIHDYTNRVHGAFGRFCGVENEYNLYKGLMRIKLTYFASLL
jgi:hypothetical protein